MDGLRQRRLAASTAPGEIPVQQDSRKNRGNSNFSTQAHLLSTDEAYDCAHQEGEGQALPLNESLDNPIPDESETSPDRLRDPRDAISGVAARQEESKLKKIAVRIVFGVGMFAVFCTLIYLGHTWICGLIALIEMLVFRELVKVRYSAYYERIQDTIPLFRTTQWLWFVVAIFYTYGAFLSEILQKNQSLHYLLKYMQYFPSISFLLYTGTFVLTISTLQRGVWI